MEIEQPDARMHNRISFSEFLFYNKILLIKKTLLLTLTHV